MNHVCLLGQAQTPVLKELPDHRLVCLFTLQTLINEQVILHQICLYGKEALNFYDAYQPRRFCYVQGQLDYYGKQREPFVRTFNYQWIQGPTA